MGSRMPATFFIFTLFTLISLPPMIQACVPCSQPRPPHSKPPSHHSPPHHGGGSHSPPHGGSGSYTPPVIIPPVIPPPVVLPPPTTYPPYTPSPPSGGGVPFPPITQPTCPIDALKLGLCVDVLGGLVHIGLGDPVQNVCCPVLGGLLELEAAVCLCTTIRIKLLNLNIFIPLALQALITCGKTPPPGFVCPPL
ncbi:hypothetical protein ACFE04_014854 [Oxalis oulophora]